MAAQALYYTKTHAFTEQMIRDKQRFHWTKYGSLTEDHQHCGRVTVPGEYLLSQQRTRVIHSS